MSNPTDGDYTYAERYGRGGYKYATPIDEATAAEVVAELTSDADYLEALTDKFSGDAEYLAGVGAALEADTSYLAAIGAALAADETFLAALGAADYLDDVSFTTSAEAADAITVDIQLLDEDGDNYAQRTMVTVWMASDVDAATPAAITGTGSIAAEGTAGGVLEELTADTSYQCVTDETGLLSLVFTDDDATADLTRYLGVMLPNGKYVVTPDAAKLVWNPS